MEQAVPAQRRRCTVHDWCTTPGGDHRVHGGALRTFTNSEGTEVRVLLTADGHEEPVVRIEVAYGPAGPGLEVMNLDTTEAVELAGVLLRLARTGHAHPAEER